MNSWLDLEFKRICFSSLICNHLAVLPWMSNFILHELSQSYIHKTWFHDAPLSHKRLTKLKGISTKL